MSIEKLIDARLKIHQEAETPAQKLLNFEESKNFIRTAKSLGKSIILVEGTWDLTHAGHVQHIREARRHADLVLLRLASAEYAHNIKGPSRPIEIYRDIVVSEFEGVDAVFVDDSVIDPDNIAENAHIIAGLNPNAIAIELEDDKFYQKFKSTVYANRNLGASVTPIVLSSQQLNSTSAIIGKVRNL